MRWGHWLDGAGGSSPSRDRGGWWAAGCFRRSALAPPRPGAFVSESSHQVEEALADAQHLEAARFERDVRDDLASAERHLSVALRLRPPTDRALGHAYREVAAALAAATAKQPR